MQRQNFSLINHAGVLAPMLVLAMVVVFASLAPRSWAAVGADMYQATVGTKSQSGEDRDKSMKYALGQVVIRLTGRSDSVYEPLVANALKKAGRYVQSFTYGRSKVNDELQLEVQFVPQLVQNLLRQSELPMWVSGRPTVLLWMAVHEGRDKQIVTPASNPELSKLVESEMARRGVPVRWPDANPRMDVEALRLLQTDDIRLASQPYAEQAAFAISAYVKPAEATEGDGDETPLNEWAGRCVYIGQADEARASCNRGERTEFLASAIDSLADQLSDRFSVQILGGESLQVRLEVIEVASFEGYGRALKHLKSNALVREANVVEVAGDKVVFELELQGTEEQFQSSLASQRVLTAVDSAEPYGSLRYRLGLN